MSIKRSVSILIVIIMLMMNIEAMNVSTGPAKVLPARIKQVAVGGEHRMIVLENGELWGWGDNLYGQIGDGTYENVVTKPMKIMDGVTSVKVTENTTYALKSNGELWGWGDIGLGQNRFIKKPVKQMDGVKDFFAGYWHVMVINNKNELWGWGSNYRGQIGDGTVKSVNKPKKIMDDVIKVYPEFDRNFAINAKGELWGWGNNENGIIAEGMGEIVSKPTKVIDGVSDIYSSREHVMVVKSNGELWGWGANNYGRIGDGTTIDVPKPKKIMDGIKNAYFERNQTFAIKTNGELWGWGCNNAGQIGIHTEKSNEFEEYIELPMEILKPTKILDGVVQVSVSEYFTEALKSNGELWEWGSIGGITAENISHIESITAFLQRYEPRKVMEDVAHVAAGRDHAIAVKKNGELFAWGANSLGQTGLGDDLSYRNFVTTPAKVMEGVEKVIVWCETTAVITANGDYWSWGFNGNALVGDGTQKDAYLPMKIFSVGANELKQ